MSAASREKGARAELEVVALCHEYGWPGARRNLNQPAIGGADLVGVPPLSIEVKRGQRLEFWSWWSQAIRQAGPTELPVLTFRRDESPWIAAVELTELLALVQLQRLA